MRDIAYHLLFHRMPKTLANSAASSASDRRVIRIGGRKIESQYCRILSSPLRNVANVRREV